MPLPPGVTLTQIDGGPSYYATSGYTHAAGWDDPGFFPVGIWLGVLAVQGDADRWADLAINTAFPLTPPSSLPLAASNVISVVQAIDSGAPVNGTPGPETTGLLAFDEPTTMSDW